MVWGILILKQSVGQQLWEYHFAQCPFTQNQHTKTIFVFLYEETQETVRNAQNELQKCNIGLAHQFHSLCYHFCSDLFDGGHRQQIRTHTESHTNLAVVRLHNYSAIVVADSNEWTFIQEKKEVCIVKERNLLWVQWVSSHYFDPNTHHYTESIIIPDSQYVHHYLSSDFFW